MAETHWWTTGVGSLPGTDPAEAAAVVAGELPEWPYLPELPARGPGADTVGRAMHLLSEVSGEFAVETSPDGWRRAAAPGRDMRRAEAFLRADCDAAAERFDGYAGRFSVAMAGPWTLAASVVDAWGERSLRDRGFVADLCQAHAEAAAGLVRRVSRLLPDAELVLFADEPALAAVHDGELSFSSGYRRHRAVAADELAAGLRGTRDAVRGAGAAFGVHSCAVPVWPVVAGLHPDWFSCDVTRLVAADAEDFGTWLESGAGTVWGVWPTRGAGTVDAAHEVVVGWLQRLGYAPTRLAADMGVSPTCGLAGATPAAAMRAMRGLAAVARRLSETD